MRTKWFKRNNQWAKVEMSDEEERKIELSFIDDYIDIFDAIHEKVSQKNEVDPTNKFALSMEIFKKLASPGHFKLERIMEERRDAEMAKEK